MNKICIFSRFTMYAINCEKMNYIKGGGDPILPPYPSEPDWQDDEPYRPDAP